MNNVNNISKTHEWWSLDGIVSKMYEFPLVNNLMPYRFYNIAATTTVHVMSTTTTHNPCVSGHTEVMDDCHNTTCVDGNVEIVLACNKQCGNVSKISHKMQLSTG